MSSISSSDIPKWLTGFEVPKEPGAKAGVYRYVIQLEKNSGNTTVEIAGDGSTDQKTQMTSHIVLLRSMRKTWKLLSDHPEERERAFATGRKVELIQEEAASSVIFKEENPQEEFFYKADQTIQKRGGVNENQFRRTALEKGNFLNLNANAKSNPRTTVHKRCEAIAQSVLLKSGGSKESFSCYVDNPEKVQKEIDKMLITLDGKSEKFALDEVFVGHFTEVELWNSFVYCCHLYEQDPEKYKNNEVFKAIYQTVVVEIRYPKGGNPKRQIEAFLEKFPRFYLDPPLSLIRTHHEINKVVYPPSCFRVWVKTLTAGFYDFFPAPVRAQDYPTLVAFLESQEEKTPLRISHLVLWKVGSEWVMHKGIEDPFALALKPREITKDLSEKVLSEFRSCFQDTIATNEGYYKAYFSE